jgi:lipoprotein-anchoring transpeptidase ErfK/SrfK
LEIGYDEARGQDRKDGVAEAALDLARISRNYRLRPVACKRGVAFIPDQYTVQAPQSGLDTDVAYAPRKLRPAGLVPPGLGNALGIRSTDLGWSEYRIRGANTPLSVGWTASSGSIGMLNADVVDLFVRVHNGAPVRVLR